MYSERPNPQPGVKSLAAVVLLTVTWGEEGSTVADRPDAWQSLSGRRLQEQEEEEQEENGVSGEVVS